MDAMFQIKRGLDEAHAVGEGVISNRLRRLGAQVCAWSGLCATDLYTVRIQHVKAR